MNRNADIRAKAHPCQAYIIALGCNDKRNFEAGNAKKDINLKDYTKNAETFAGYYGGIIQRVKEFQPDAHFFVVTLPQMYGDKDFSEQVRAMAEIFDQTYVIDFEKYAIDFSAPGNREKYMLMGHLNAAGYQYVAWMFLTYINSIIEQNLPAFADVALMN